MEWVHKHIAAFGGKPDQVTMYVAISTCFGAWDTNVNFSLYPHSSWGESAGAYSVGFQLLINDGITQGLSMEHSWYGCSPQFSNLQKIILQESGSPYNLRDMTAQQPRIDQLVADTGCTGSPDLIACLRSVPFDKLMTAVNKSPNAFSFTSVRLGWQPSVDGQIIVRSPQESLQKGLYARVRTSLTFPSILSPVEGPFF